MNDKWLKRLVGKVCEACVNEVKGRMSGFNFRWSAPDDNSWGCWLIGVAPEPLELVENGPNDGDGIFDPVDVDLLRLGQVLSQVESLTYEPGSQYDQPHIQMTGRYGKREVVVHVFFEPFDDVEAERVFDAVNKCWRLKKQDDE